jgi:hypothetical protein
MVVAPALNEIPLSTACDTDVPWQLPKAGRRIVPRISAAGCVTATDARGRISRARRIGNWDNPWDRIAERTCAHFKAQL